ncbi:unnamed protein product [Sphagnum jensenii]|uniref:Phosphatidylinositol 4-phosphate 5-kinase n=1 Tax=Sphagnum jensenii TaxID=128206 RepID=A0ABP0X818_9BRYO
MGPPPSDYRTKDQTKPTATNTPSIGSPLPLNHFSVGEDEERVVVSSPVRELCVTGEKVLPNGDFYVGSWQGNLPEGTGKYLWADGCMYEGEWRRGKKTGKGKISWPTGATYEGEFMGGYMHGVGTYTGNGGTTYKGQWSMNVKHGHGRKTYANGDVYAGFWKQGVQEGFAKYVWANGNEYQGEWRGGSMCGKGVLTWASGDRFDGQWLDGLEHGHGIYTWVDGSCYIGTWSRGLKDGKGVFYPAGSLSPGMSLLRNTDRAAPRDDSLWTSHQSHRLGDDGRELRAPQRSRSHSSSSEKFLHVGDLSMTVVREYVQGVLMSELVKENVESAGHKKRRTRKASKEIKRPGETIFKGHRSYDLMLNLQLGIRYTVGKITPEPKHDIGPTDFGSRASIRMNFPRGGTSLTPTHDSCDFKWKDYCPMVFRHLREMFKIDAADYMLSLCGDDALRELVSPGKSGSVFYLSHDDRFMIKTMKKSEVRVLLDMLQGYHHHVQVHENTLITKFFGLHRIKPYGGRKVRFIVMGNMFCTELRIHRRFDLKGSSLGRSADKVEIDETTTLKDLDLEYEFSLDPSWRESLLKQIERDCKFLEAWGIMDYSLLLGLHFRAPQYPALLSPGPSSTPDLPPSELFMSTADHGSLLLSYLFLLRIQLGVNMPARADRVHKRSEEQGSKNFEGELFGESHDVVLYFGIIDILQNYSFMKRIEHAYKACHFDSTSISAVEPKLYSKRFQKFIQKIFPPTYL